MYYVYVLQSKKDGNLYIGKSKDLKSRLKQHQSGQVVATKARQPVELIFYEAFTNWSDAGRDELFYKSGYGREILRDKLKFSLQTSKR